MTGPPLVSHLTAGHVVAEYLLPEDTVPQPALRTTATIIQHRVNIGSALVCICVFSENTGGASALHGSGNLRAS
jgi:hypothetical protein